MGKDALFPGSDKVLQDADHLFNTRRIHPDVYLKKIQNMINAETTAILENLVLKKGLSQADEKMALLCSAIRQQYPQLDDVANIIEAYHANTKILREEIGKLRRGLFGFLLIDSMALRSEVRDNGLPVGDSNNSPW